MQQISLRFLRQLLVLTLLALLCALPALGQEVPMSVVRLDIDLKTHDPVVILENKEMGKSLTIPIGPFEATAIAMPLEDTKFPRPLSHDLMRSVIEALKARLDKVVIHKVEGETYYARLCLTDSAGATLELDARPSDSIALALRTKSPIYVTEFVLQHPPAKAPEPIKPKAAKIGARLSSQEKKRKRALELVREGEKIGAFAFTSPNGGFEPFRESSENTYRKAIPKYNEALKLCPKLAQAYAARSTAYYFMGDIPKAKKDAKTALRLGGLRAPELMLLSAPFQGAESREISRRSMKLVGPDSPMYSHLWHNLARTYWYEGDFANEAKELEAIVAWQKAHHSRFPELTKMSLASAYDAMGNLEKAEEIYQEIGDGDMLVRLYIHQERWSDARAALSQYPDEFEADEKIVFSAGIDELEGKLDKVSSEQMAAAERLGEGGTYYAFFLGLFQLRDGKTATGHETLRAFCASCKSNPREWGVTMAWEVRRAEQILQSY